MDADDYPNWVGMVRLLRQMRRLAVRDLLTGNKRQRVSAYIYLTSWLAEVEDDDRTDSSDVDAGASGWRRCVGR